MSGITAPAVSRLVKKLASVMATIERIPKRGHNNFHNYDYATEADIVAVVRQELAKRHVMLIPAIIGREREPVGEKGSVLTHLDMAFTFLDGETGEEKTFRWLGAGTDKEDKGAYKAMTGGEKYFLLKTFLIPTGDDPEVEADEQPAAVGQPRTRAPQPQTTASTQPARTPQTAAPRTERPAAPPPLTREDVPPGLRVTNAKIAKQGQSAKGPWTLYAIKFSDGREATTFSKSLFEAADDACQTGQLVDVEIEETDNKKHLVTMTAVFQQDDQEFLESEIV